jgi:DNA-binding LacI/PurR family transcriptional regulator
METNAIRRSSVHQLVERLEQDIRCRGLREGDRYFSTVEVGKMLGVSPATAHRALKVLTDSQSLVRRPNSGTFVGPRAGSKPRVAIRTVYLLIDAAAYADHCYRFDLMAKGIREEMNDVNIQLCYLPERDATQYVTELLTTANSVGEVAGVVPMSCGREVYRVMAYSGLPTVVMGSLYLGDPTLASIDMDNHEAGNLLVHHLHSRGHRRIAMLPPPELRPGDNARFAGVSDAMTALHMPHNTLLVHSVPHDDVALPAITESLLSATERPTGFIVWSSSAAETVAATILQMGLRIPDDIEIVYFDHAMETHERPAFTCIRPQARFETFGSTAAKILKRLSDRDPLAKERIVMSVELVGPN